MNNISQPETAQIAAEAAAPKKRGQSTIKFPYADLGDAEHVAIRVHQGGGACKHEQLAAWLNHGTPNSGAFRNKVSAARIFGLVETSRDGITLTDLGQKIAADHSRAEARVEAFFRVSLYKALYEKFKTGQLPPDTGIQHEMMRLGVTPTQAQNARQVFQRSADHAGFFAVSRQRLVLPATASYVAASEGDGPGGDAQRRGVDPVPPDGEPRKYPKVIEGILEEAPWGTRWDEAEFVEWADLLVRAARVHFKLPSKREAGG